MWCIDLCFERLSYDYILIYLAECKFTVSLFVNVLPLNLTIRSEGERNLSLDVRALSRLFRQICLKLCKLPFRYKGPFRFSMAHGPRNQHLKCPIQPLNSFSQGFLFLHTHANVATCLGLHYTNTKKKRCNVSINTLCDCYLWFCILKKCDVTLKICMYLSNYAQHLPTFNLAIFQNFFPLGLVSRSNVFIFVTDAGVIFWLPCTSMTHINPSTSLIKCDVFLNLQN